MAQVEFTAIEKTILTIGILTTLGSFIYEIWRRLRVVFKGKQSLPFDRFGARLWRVFREVFLHEKVIRDRFWPGFMHALVFWGFIVFGLVMRRRLRKRRRFRSHDRGAPVNHVAHADNDVQTENLSSPISLPEDKTPEKIQTKSQATNITGRCITIFVIAEENKTFAGYELLQSLLACGLRFGDKQIFHHYVDHDKESGVLFSLASATKPGIFELGSIGSFKCEGLVLFMAEGVTHFDERALQCLLTTAQELVQDFGGEIWGPDKKPLTSSSRADLFAMVNAPFEVSVE